MPFEPTWESLSAYTAPEWFKRAKFGIFIHWGIYSVPAFDNEWYSRNMYQPGTRAYNHHRETWGDHTQFGYKDFIPMFKAEKFDADAWLTLFKEAGARYIVPVAEHHDGFAMYDSALSEWTAAKMGPCRDVLGELATAAQANGLAFGLSFHRAENWWFFNGGRDFPSDVTDPQNFGLYGYATPSPSEHNGGFASAEWNSKDWMPRPHAKFLDDWLARCTELVERYDPKLFYFDWWIEQTVFTPYRQKFAAAYYNGVPPEKWAESGVVLAYKHESFPAGTALYDLERGKLNDIRQPYWQTDTSVSYKSWCYLTDDHLKSATTLVHDLVDVVSKNGNLLLNVGPKADGTISDDVAALLREMGAWLKVNGEAIYESQHWHIFGEGPVVQPEGKMREHEDKPFTAEDIRFTTKPGALYAICLGWPGQKAVIKSLGTGGRLDAAQIESIHMLGSSQSLSWTQGEDGLEIETPAERPCDHAYTFKIMLK